jgi:serine/threonine-protein kinase
MSGTERWVRVDALLQQALDLSEQERSAFLARECGGDDSLQREVLELLDADRKAGAFLGGAGDAGGPGAVRASGERVGPYRLERLLGRGGMSSVYLAARADGAFERRVALKVLEQGAIKADWRQRFHIERQVLARLEHPLIARLLDGGTTADGCPYLVMELVEGRPIDRYCSEQDLTVRERIALLRKVCEAVAWAHRNLIVHRDLKPGNVLVTGTGEARLLDFGIAKLLEPSAFDLSVEETATQLRLMSPGYASPEQITGGTITTATDVWALGVVAYEVLTGVRPFGSPSSLSELEASRRKEPELPSRCAEAADVQRRAALRRQLRGDLDTIVLKALRAEPERRYGTAEELGADLGRYLEGLPVAARPDGLLYRAGKLVRRHALPVAMAAASLLVILSLVVGLALQAGRLRTERDKAREAIELLAEVLRQDGGKQGEEMTVRQALQKAEPGLRRRLADQPHLLALMLTTIGSVYHDLGSYAEARPPLEEARHLATQAGQLHEHHGAALTLGLLEQTVGSYDRAEALYREALDVARREHGPSHQDVAAALAHLGCLAYQREKPQEGLAPLQAAVAIFDRPGERPNYNMAAFAHASLGGVYQLLGRPDEAEGNVRRAFAIATENDIRPYRFILENDIATLQVGRGDFAAALDGFGRSIRGLEAEMGPKHPNTAHVRVNLCRALEKSGDLSGAVPVCRQAYADLLAAFGPEHAETRWAQERLSQVLQQLEAPRH